MNDRSIIPSVQGDAALTLQMVPHYDTHVLRIQTYLSTDTDDEDEEYGDIEVPIGDFLRAVRELIDPDGAAAAGREAS